ncbi:MAG: aminodeoxychorismate lyase [Pseudomonadota bacterium]|nr:aminodeoxychorismate lyase [Pseudomonadota bacterium]
MTMQAWVNGQKQSQISVLDRSVQYGDGFFTTMLVIDDKLFNWQAHWWRLQSSAERLAFPPLKEIQVWQRITSAIESYQSEFKAFTPLVVKLIVTRGEGGKGYQPSSKSEVTMIVQVGGHPVFECSEHFDELQAVLNLGQCKTLCSIQPQLAGLKHLNRLENVLARNELLELDTSEAIMLNANQEVISATQSNLFVIKNRTLMTPKLDCSGVAGTTRYQMQAIASQCGLGYSEKVLHLDDVFAADELFLTNALRGVMPVKQFKQTRYSCECSFEIHQAWCEWQKQNARSIT